MLLACRLDYLQFTPFLQWLYGRALRIRRQCCALHPANHLYTLPAREGQHKRGGVFLWVLLFATVVFAGVAVYEAISVLATELAYTDGGVWMFSWELTMEMFGQYR
jgi:hypothetical protein